MRTLRRYAYNHYNEKTHLGDSKKQNTIKLHKLQFRQNTEWTKDWLEP